MAWGSRYNTSYRAPVQRTVWQTGGANISISRATATYDVTEDDIRNAVPPIETRHRSYMGNGYFIVKIEDMVNLERRLKEQKEIAKHGSREAWEQHQKEEREHQAKELQEKRALEEKERQDKEVQAKQDALKKSIEAVKMSFVNKYLKILKLSIGKEEHIPDSIDELKLSKTTAKKDWLLRDKDLEGLHGQKEGRTVQYDVRELIKAAEKRVGYVPETERFTPLLSKLADRPVAQLGIYIRFLKEKLSHELKARYDDDVAQQVRDKAEQNLAKEVDERQKKIGEVENNLKAAQMDHSRSVQLLKLFKRTFPPTVAVSQQANASCEKENENGTPRPQKKQKQTSSN